MIAIQRVILTILMVGSAFLGLLSLLAARMALLNNPEQIPGQINAALPGYIVAGLALVSFLVALYKIKQLPRDEG